MQDLPPLDWLDPQSALHVLRILQEVLTNILKHSRATAIDVATAHEGDEVVVSIRDDGPIVRPRRRGHRGRPGPGQHPHPGAGAAGPVRLVGLGARHRVPPAAAGERATPGLIA